MSCRINRMDVCQSTIVYERRESAQVLYVIPVSSILGRLSLVPVSNTGTIPYEMLPTFQALLATKQRTAKTVAGSGT